MRLGWLAQTALLGVQAAREDGFPWGTWAGSLNLFVWLVVGAYLIWGCRARYRLLGLAVHAARGRRCSSSRARAAAPAIGQRSHYSNLFLVLHVGLVLAAFAGFTLAAALSALYLWQERRLKRREATILRVRAPSLATLDELAARTIAVPLPALTLGIAVGIVRLRSDGGGFDAVVVVTLVTWAVSAAYLVLRLATAARPPRRVRRLVGFVLVDRRPPRAPRRALR